MPQRARESVAPPEAPHGVAATAAFVAATVRVGALVATIACLLPGAARAAPWPADLGDPDDDAIDAAWRDGALDDDARERLLAQMAAPVDLATADRDALFELPGLTWEQVDAIRAWRDAHGFARVEDLAAVPGIDADTMERLRPFVTVERGAPGRAVRGRADAGAVWRTRGGGPAAWLRAAMELPGSVRAGVLLAMRPRFGTARSAAAGRSIAVPRRAVRFDPAGAYVAWEGERWSVVAGTFRVGFGARLTIDSTGRERPDGWRPALDTAVSLADGSLATPDGFWGAAVRHRPAPGRAGPDATAFASYRLLDVPVRDLHYDRCPAGEPGCGDARKVPAAVDAAGGKSLSCTPPTLPWALHEALGGLHVAWRFDERAVVGATGYAAWRRYALRAKGLRPAVHARHPWDRDVSGAVGVHGTFGRGPVDATAEVAVTDRGAPAAVAEAWFRAAPGVQVDVSLRYYAPGYDNPYARAPANADRFQGIAGRDEVGGRLGLDWRALPALRIRAGIDAWHHRFANESCDPDAAAGAPEACVAPSANPAARAATPRPTTDLALDIEARVTPTPHERATLQLGYRDEDLARSGRRLSDAAATGASGDGSGGARVRWSVEAATDRLRRFRVAAGFRQVFQDEQALATRFDRSWNAWVDVRADLSPGPWIGLRAGYLDRSTVDDPDRAPTQSCASWEPGDAWPEELPGRCRGESRVDLRLHASQRVGLGGGAGLVVRLAGAWTRWTDDRARWRDGTPCDRRPARDAFALRAGLEARF